MTLPTAVAVTRSEGGKNFELTIGPPKFKKAAARPLKTIEQYCSHNNEAADVSAPHTRRKNIGNVRSKVQSPMTKAHKTNVWRRPNLLARDDDIGMDTSIAMLAVFANHAIVLSLQP